MLAASTIAREVLRRETSSRYSASSIVPCERNRLSDALSLCLPCFFKVVLYLIQYRISSHSVSVLPAYTRQTTLQCLADMDWSTVISTLVGVIAGGLVNAYFSWQGSKELR